MDKVLIFRTHGCPSCGGELMNCSPSGNGVAACDSCQRYWEEDDLPNWEVCQERSRWAGKVLRYLLPEGKEICLAEILPGQIAIVRFGQRLAYRGDAYENGAIDYNRGIWGYSVALIDKEEATLIWNYNNDKLEEAIEKVASLLREFS